MHPKAISWDICVPFVWQCCVCASLVSMRLCCVSVIVLLECVCVWRAFIFLHVRVALMWVCNLCLQWYLVVWPCVLCLCLRSLFLCGCGVYMMGNNPLTQCASISHLIFGENVNFPLYAQRSMLTNSLHDMPPCMIENEPQSINHGISLWMIKFDHAFLTC